jgi:hypothetical protein
MLRYVAVPPSLFTKQKDPSWASWQVSAIFVYKGLVAGKHHLCLQKKRQLQAGPRGRQAPSLFTKQKALSWASWQVSAIFVYKKERSKLSLVAGKRHAAIFV